MGHCNSHIVVRTNSYAESINDLVQECSPMVRTRVYTPWGGAALCCAEIFPRTARIRGAATTFLRVRSARSTSRAVQKLSRGRQSTVAASASPRPWIGRLIKTNSDTPTRKFAVGPRKVGRGRGPRRRNNIHYIIHIIIGVRTEDLLLVKLSPEL